MRPSKKMRVLSGTSGSELPALVLDSTTTSTPYAVNGSKRSVVVPPSPRNELLRGGDARRKWALGSEVELEQASEQDMESRAARRKAYASKLSSHFSTRNRVIWEVEAIPGPAGSPADGDNSVGEEAGVEVDEGNERLPKGLSRSFKKYSGIKGKEGANAAVGPSGQTWTPLENQVGA
jgi:hypothetical protein